MTNEEKKTIDKLKNGKKYTLVEIIRVFKKEGIENFRITRKEYLDIILNLLEKQDNRIKELESDKEIKNKIIDRMAEYINELDIDEDICTKNIINPELCNEQYSNCKECIKQYFENKAKESGEIDEDVLQDKKTR